MLITKQQPIVSDLRYDDFFIKIASDLERIEIMHRVLPIFDCVQRLQDDYVLTRLKTMGKLAMLMLGLRSSI